MTAPWPVGASSGARGPTPVAAAPRPSGGLRSPSSRPLDVLLVHPGGRRATYQDLADGLAAVEPPLWCRLIAGYLRDRGWRVAILDADARGLGYLDVTSHVNALNPLLVAVVAAGHQPSASTQAMTEAGAICRSLATFGDANTILVGGHVAALTVRTMEEEACTFACTGEGPETIHQLLTALTSEEGDLRTVLGLAWRGAGIVVNPPAPLCDMADLHGDVWGLLDVKLYRAHNWQVEGDEPRQPYASVMTSLGCPYRCEFCCINAPFSATSKGGNAYRRRRPVDVVAEITSLYLTYGVRTFKITDEMFVLNRAHVRAICQGLVDAGIGGELNIWAYARVDTVHEEDLALMRAAGIRWLALGIESADETVRDGAEKHLDPFAVRDVVKQIQAAGIKVLGNFIFGLPHDTRTSMERTLYLAVNLELDFANFYVAMAYPGSRLFATADPRDLPRTWAGYAQHAYEARPLPTAACSAAEVLAFRDMAQEVYFHDHPELARPLRRRLLEPAEVV